MQTKITIAMDNAAFAEEPGTELARILRKCAQDAEEGITYRPLFDLNGNRVGSFEILES